MPTRNTCNRLTRLVTLRHNRRPIFSCTLHRLLTLKAIPIIKHQITSKNSGGQNLTSDQNPIPWAVRTAYSLPDALSEADQTIETGDADFDNKAETVRVFYTLQTPFP